ncbi:unnamed protein product (macronuclear) [Paramecium tetraurelia]|uniref:Uncharacterized protein n=1 Tax=Paramecium tetraurelia TaxID=5888 RepID=A0EHZ1_PARTE|nr:uncharacterized protein GSPATT00027259001 [Paramecium tetraurelia]CAK94932.1 unnamed protein product [Paramecium tetraurelia]|eukprot:XP_001462305.1 hypothetical protein (macronuclear) [Paramecium tetraurelia strain d4-2]
MDELNNRQTPKLRFRQQQVQQKAIESDPKQTQIARLPSGSKNAIALPRLDSRAATQSLVMKDVDKEMNQLELSSKVRDLEILMIDFKANIERRIQKTIEDNPQKYMQSIKQLESQEMHLWKQVNDKQAILQDAISQLRNQGEKNRDNLSQMILDLQKKCNDQELKLGALINQQEGIELKLNVSKPTSIQPVPDNLEVKLLREAFNNEKTHRDVIVEDLQKQWQDFHYRLVKQESDFYNKLKQQREEFLEQNEKTKVSIKALDNMKLAKINQDQDYIKNLIGSVEARIADEVERRLKSEFDQRNQLENKIQAFKEEIRNDEKQILLGEQKFMKQMHDSVSSLNQIIKNTKEQLEANLAASQTIVTENIKSISKTVDMIRESSLAKVALIEQGQKELNFRVGETRQMMHEHANLINNSLQKEFQRQQDQLQGYESQMQKSIEIQNKLLNDERTLNEDWKKQFAQKNLVIFTEVSTNLKNIKGDQIKDKNELQEGLKKITNDVENNDKKQLQLMKNLDQKVNQGLNSQEFKLDQLRIELSEIIKNIQLQYNIQMHEQIQFAIETAKKDATQQVLESSQQINDRITREIEMADQQTNAKLDSLSIQMKDLIRNREEYILQRLQSMIDEEKELRQRLQELIEKYGDMVRKLKEDLDYEMQQLRRDQDEKLNEAIQKIERDYSEKVKDIERQLKQEILNSENRMQTKLDVLSLEFSKTMEQMKLYIKKIENTLKSYVQQELEQTKHDLKMMIKGIEDDVFKLRIWTIQQMEKMDSAMKEIHIQIQTEMYLERMYTMTTLENFQEHLINVMNKEKQDRLQWQFSMENQLNQLDMSLNNKIDSVQNNLQQQLDDVNAEFKQAVQKLNEQINEQLGKLEEDFNQKLNDVHEQVKQAAKDLEDKINQQMDKMNEEINQQLTQFKNDVENQFQELTEKIKQDLQDLFDEINQKVNNLRVDTQNGLTQVVKLQTTLGNQLKSQIDESFAYFQSKFYLMEQIRQANEELDKERHTGIIGKLQLLVKEMERLEQKKNQIKKDLNDFVKGVQNNFNNITDAIKAHGQFLNELDSKLTIELLLQQTINEAQEYKLQAQLIEMNKNSEGKIQELEEKLTNFDTTIHNQLEQIQVDQEETNNRIETEQKNHQEQIKMQEEQLKIQEDQLKTQDEQLKLSFVQLQQIVGNIQLMKTMNGAMEINLSDYVKTQIQQTLELILKNNQTNLDNMVKQEKNIKLLIEGKIGQQNQNLKQITDYVDKIVQDTTQMQVDVNTEFEKVNDKIQLLQKEQGQGQSQSKDLDQNMVAYGIALDTVKKDLEGEIKRLQTQIDNLGQNVAFQKTGNQDKNQPQSDNKMKEMEIRINDIEQDFQKQGTDIESLKNQVKTLQSNKQIQSPVSQTPNNKSQNNQQQMDMFAKEIDRIDQEINKLKNQISKLGSGVAGGAAVNNSDATKEIQELKSYVEDFEKGVTTEIQNFRTEVESMKKNKSGSAATGITAEEFGQFQSQLDEEFNKYDGQIQQLNEEIQVVKNQSTGGAGKAGDNKLIEGRLKLMEQKLLDLEGEITQMQDVIDEHDGKLNDIAK